MPGESGELTEAEQGKVNAWLDKHWPREKRACPISGPTNWVIHNTVLEFPVYSKAAIIGPTIYPIVLLYCQECGYTIHFSAVQIGLFEEEVKKRDAGAKEAATAESTEVSDG